MPVAATSWPDKVVAIATLAGVVGGVGALVVAATQLRLQTKQGEEQIAIRSAQRAVDLMRPLITVESLAVTHPELYPYVRLGKEIPSEGDPLRDKVLAYGLLFSDIAEMVGRQIYAVQVTEAGARAWRRYFEDLQRTSPAVTHVFAVQGPLYITETDWVIGKNVESDSLVRVGVVKRS